MHLLSIYHSLASRTLNNNGLNLSAFAVKKFKKNKKSGIRIYTSPTKKPWHIFEYVIDPY